jgi:hypothetical protein
MLGAKQIATPISIWSMDLIDSLVWAENKEELDEYFKWSLHPCDCEKLVLDRISNAFGNRKVYMTYKTLQYSSVKSINIPATRILLDNNMMEPPTIEYQTSDLMIYTYCMPSDHVIFHQTIDGKFTDYTYEQFTSDWSLMFNKTPKYKQLAHQRYKHYGQALTEFEFTGQMNSLVVSLIEHYLKKRVGPCSHWTEAQMLVLGAALYMLYSKQWDAALSTPSVAKLII